MADETEVKSFGKGKYSFIIGKLTYTMTTQLQEEDFKRLVVNVRNLVAEYPPYLNQDERLVMALMSVSHKLEDLQVKLDAAVTRALTDPGANS